jgi:transposase InsO family protein
MASKRTHYSSVPPVFESLSHLNALAEQWLREEADRRVHGTVKEVVEERFERERPHFRPLPPTRFDTSYREYRVVACDGYVDVRGNRYTVPDDLCGKTVEIRIRLDGRLRILSGDELVVEHSLRPRSEGWVTVAAHHEKLWEACVSDITYIPKGEGWLYLAATTDLYGRRIVGWSMGEKVNRELTIAALDMAVRTRRPKRGLIHRSDRGSQYACDNYRRKLRRHGMVSSMSRKDDCYDDAVMECFFSSMKRQWVFGRRYATRREARADLFAYTEVFCNRRRRHSSLGYLGPVQFEERRHAA